MPRDRGLTDLVVLSSMLEATCGSYRLAGCPSGTDIASTLNGVPLFLSIVWQRRHDEAWHLRGLQKRP